MYLAAEAAAQTASNFSGFDPFVILFTIIIAIGAVRLLGAPKKNHFAIGFASVSLLVFLIMDAVMVMHWMGKM
jgi:arginine exporter protein ArgO